MSLKQASACKLTELSTSYDDQFTSSSKPELYACDIKRLQQPFPNFPPEFTADLYTVSKHDFTATLECLLEGNLSSVLSLINTGVLGDPPDLLSISFTRLDSDKDELVASVFQFYKKHDCVI